MGWSRSAHAEANPGLRREARPHDTLPRRQSQQVLPAFPQFIPRDAMLALVRRKRLHGQVSPFDVKVEGDG